HHISRPLTFTLFPYTTLFRSDQHALRRVVEVEIDLETVVGGPAAQRQVALHLPALAAVVKDALGPEQAQGRLALEAGVLERDARSEERRVGEGVRQRGW